jgi:hypothetical protein
VAEFVNGNTGLRIVMDSIIKEHDSLTIHTTTGHLGGHGRATERFRIIVSVNRADIEGINQIQFDDRSAHFHGENFTDETLIICQGYGWKDCRTEDLYEWLNQWIESKKYVQN